MGKTRSQKVVDKPTALPPTKIEKPAAKSHKNLMKPDDISVECSVQVERLDPSKYKMFSDFTLDSRPSSVVELATKPKKSEPVPPVAQTARTFRSRATKKYVDYINSERPSQAEVRGTNKNIEAVLKEEKKLPKRGKNKTHNESKLIVDPKTRRGQTKAAESINNRAKSSDNDKENKEAAKQQTLEVEFVASDCVVEVEKLTAKQVADLEQNGKTTVQEVTKASTKSRKAKDPEELQKEIKKTYENARKVLRDRGPISVNTNCASDKSDASEAMQPGSFIKAPSVKIQESRVIIKRLSSATIKSLTASTSKEKIRNVTKPKKDIPARTAKTTRSATAKQILEVAQSEPSKEISSIKVQTSHVSIERLPRVTSPKISKSGSKKNPKASSLSPEPATPLNKFQNVAKRVNKRKAVPAFNDELPKRLTRRNDKDLESIPQEKTFDDKVTSRRGGKDNKKIRKTSTCYVSEKNVSPVSSSVSPTQAVRETTLSPSVVNSSPSNLLKGIEMPDNHDNDDPYSFDMSQNEANNKKKAKKPVKKQVPKSKPGNKIDILMKQKALDAIEFSCNVQNNPTSYVAQRETVEKQIKVPAPRVQQVVDVDAPCTSRMAAQLSKIATSPQKQIIAPAPRVQRVIDVVAPGTSRMPLSKAATSHSVFSKVYHSPKSSVSPNYQVSPGASCSKAYASPNHEAFRSQSPPIQSAYALNMISALRKGNVNQNASSPFRVPGNLPTTFYMELSGNDGAPTYSSDLLGERRVDNFDEDVNLQHEIIGKKSNDSTISESYKSTDTSKGKISDEHSALADSNAENLEPVGMIKSPIKNMGRNILRSPFKSLPLPAMPENEVSYLSIANSTVDQSITLKNKTVVNQEQGNESLDLLEICEKDCRQKDQRRSTAESSRVYSEEPESRDAFGFDELLGNDRQTSQQPSVSETADTNLDIRQHLQKFKRYLPSNKNKNRDKNIFPTSSMSESVAFNEPSTSQSSIKGFFSSSTPIATAKKNTRAPFTDMSKIAEASETTIDDTNISANDESIDELFSEDQTELHQPRRSYTRHKPGFLKRVESESGSDDEDEPKASSKTKRKKPNVEETGEYKKFVQNKSQEFAEVESYEMVIE